MLTLDQWLSGSPLRHCSTRRNYPHTHVTLRDENGHSVRAAGDTRDEAEETALRLYEREQIEARAQVDADDAEFERQLMERRPGSSSCR